MKSQSVFSILIIVIFLSYHASACQTTEYQDASNNCIACSGGCTACFNDTYCTSCDTLYYYDAANSICTSCVTNCINCTSSALTCDSCKPGYLQETDSNGILSCVLYWWYIFLIVFGIIFGVGLIILAIYCVRKKLKDSEDEEEDKEIQFKKKQKLQMTQSNIQT